MKIYWHSNIYEVLGRRIEKYQIDREGKPYNRNRFLWDGLRIIQETDPNHPTILYIYTELNGCPEELTDENGEILLECSFQLWGKRIHEIEHVSVEQNLRYQGQYLERKTGLHYNTFRYYDLDIGRFTQPDPIGLLGGFNLYQYAPNGLTWIFEPWGWSCNPSQAIRSIKKQLTKGREALISVRNKADAEEILKALISTDKKHPPR